MKRTPETIHRDATFSQATRDQLARARAVLDGRVAVTNDDLDDLDDLVAAIDHVVTRWDSNDATEELFDPAETELDG